ncbi:hypothetical protein VQH23_22610 [Pararoseomonas sp. SCSIO 73927]|uniref:hypothetical protein n=1 Tax=Pararoseomonas sp. SCSIO 73927 TaxID=3114537 RepID=UPI0030D39146
MIAFTVNWHPEDQAWLLASQNRRGFPLGVAGSQLLAAGILLALAAPLAGRLADWATVNPADAAPLLRPLAWDDAVVAGVILGVALLVILISLRTERFGLRTMLEMREAEGREPLLGPVAVTLGPDRATFRGAAWESTFDAGLLTGIEEPPGYLLLRFGPARPVMLPRRDMTAPEADAVRSWAAGMLERGHPASGRAGAGEGA